MTTRSGGGWQREARRRGLLALVTSACLWVGPHGWVAARSSAAVEPSSEAGPARVLVLPSRVSGQLPPNTASEVRTIVADELVDDGLTVLPADVAAAPDCDQACRVAAAERSGADYLVQAQVVGEEDEFTVTVTLHAGDTGEALAPFSNECSICGFVEVRDMVRLAALDARAEVIRRRRALAPAPTVIRPEVVPAKPELLPRSRLVPAGWGLVGAGSAATIGGVVLLALHHRSAGCQANPRGGECIPLRFTTAPAGAAVLGAGVAAVVGGVVMVVLGRRAERRQVEGVAVRPYGLGLRF